MYSFIFRPYIFTILMVFLSSFSLVPYPWFQALACLGLRKPHSRLSQALAVVLTSKVQAESEGNSSGAETQDSKHWHQYVRGESRTWHQAVQTVLSWSGFRGKRSHQMKRLGREELWEPFKQIKGWISSVFFFLFVSFWHFAVATFHVSGS